MKLLNPIICAVDTIDSEKAAKLASELYDDVGAIKLGLEFFTAHGGNGILKLAEQVPEEKQGRIFLDLKFHDIPNTVAGAVRATAPINSFMMTVHTAGGAAMMKAAKQAALGLPHNPFVVGVTVLTSMDQGDLDSIGVADKVNDQVKRLAALAQKSGLDGVVCSAHEIEVLRRECGKNFILVVPGIRPAGSDVGDQKRVMTPKEAMDAGASYLVIGRPITGAADPKDAAKRIVSSLK